MESLFDDLDACLPAREVFAPGAVLLRGLALPVAEVLLSAIEQIVAEAPFRHMQTPGGRPMAVAMTNCGPLGWISKPSGYLYSANDPLLQRPWPAMPSAFQQLASQAAAEAGYGDFVADACLVNRYQPGTRLSLHQDRDERDFGQPIVSVSLGLKAVFQFGGPKRNDPVRRLSLSHGDVVVWGGPSRLNYHGVLALAEGEHPRCGRQRLNLTFRRAR